MCAKTIFYILSFLLLLVVAVLDALRFARTEMESRNNNGIFYIYIYTYDTRYETLVLDSGDGGEVNRKDGFARQRRKFKQCCIASH